MHPTYRTPVNAVHLQGVLGIVLAVAAGTDLQGRHTGGPLTTYIFIGYALGLLFAGMYIAVNLAVDRLLPAASGGTSSTWSST